MKEPKEPKRTIARKHDPAEVLAVVVTYPGRTAKELHALANGELGFKSWEVMYQTLLRLKKELGLLAARKSIERTPGTRAGKACTQTGPVNRWWLTAKGAKMLMKRWKDAAKEGSDG